MSCSSRRARGCRRRLRRAACEDPGGTFHRNPPDVGILASLDGLNGPTFDAGRVHLLIREFYEHTSRFKLLDHSRVAAG